MKFTPSLTACLLPFALAAIVRADEPIKFNPPAAPAAAPAASTAAPAAQAAPAALTEEQLAEEIGWLVAKQERLAELHFSPAQVEALLKGFTAEMTGNPAPYDVDKAGPQVNAYMQQKQAALVQQLKQQGTQQSLAFFTKLKENKAIVELPSGLRYEIVQQGQGDYPKPTDTVKVNYTGTLVDGTVFDSSVQRGQPVEFPLDQVIPGWTEGIQKINKGGKIRLYIPPSLAYGDEGRPGIPPASTLIFDVELLDIKPGAAPAVQPAAPAAAQPHG